MSSWLLSIVGVVFLSILFDLIYPNGKTNAFCKSIFGIIAIFIIISPILKIDIDNIDINSSTTNALVENINKSKENSIKLKIEAHLKNCGINGVIVRIESNLTTESFEIEKIYIDSTNLVLTENITNINKYEVITKEVAQLLEIDSKRIVVYG